MDQDQVGRVSCEASEAAGRIEICLTEYLWQMEKENEPSTAQRKKGILARWEKVRAGRTVFGRTPCIDLPVRVR